MSAIKSAEQNVTEVRLVEAASQLFARQGFKATTTREIAQLANLNEVTLFRYFPRKSDLFLAALEFHLCRISIGQDLQSGLAEGDDPEIVLPRVVIFILHVLDTQPELQHLLHVAGFELPESRKTIQDHLGPVIDLLVAYFKRATENQTVRDVDPVLAALGLMGVVVAHQTLQALVTREPLSDSHPEQAIASYVELYLHGLRLVPEQMRNPHECCASN